MPKAIRPIRIDGGAAYIPLTQGYEAVIDAADVHLVEGVCWTALAVRRPDGSVRTVYAYRKTTDAAGKQHTVYLHRLIMAAGALEVDHINGEGLDNRRANLRIASRAENARNKGLPVTNTSGFKGVARHKGTGRWMARIKLGGKNNHLGYFACRTAAVIAYAKASTRLHGQFGRVA